MAAAEAPLVAAGAEAAEGKLEELVAGAAVEGTAPAARGAEARERAEGVVVVREAPVRAAMVAEVREAAERAEATAEATAEAARAAVRAAAATAVAREAGMVVAAMV